MTLTGQSLVVPLLSLVVAGLIVLVIATTTYMVGKYGERRLWRSVIGKLRNDKRELELTCSAQSRLIEKLQQRIQHFESGLQR
jgi:Holliday junction resolvasome RuvABC endonuclease subunit